MHRGTGNFPDEVKEAMDQVRDDLALDGKKLSESAFIVYAVSRLCVELGRLPHARQDIPIAALFKK